MSKVSNYLMSCAACLFVIAFLLPDHYPPLATFYQDMVSWLALLSALVAISLFKPTRILVSPAMFVLLIIALIPILQYIFGIIFYFGDAILVFLYLAGFAVAVLVGFNWQQQSSTKQIVCPTDSLLACLFVAAIISSGIAAYQWLGLTQAGIWIVDVPPGSGGNGNLAQRNNLGSLLWMGLVATFYFWQRGLFSRYSVAIIGGFLVLGLALSQSRTPWITAGVAVFWIFSQRHIIGKWREQLCWIIGFSVFYLLLTLLLLPALAGGLLLSHQEYLRSTEVGARQVMWESMVAAISSGPWWGFGWNQVTVAQFLVVHDFPVSTWTEHSHNLFLDLLIWNGPIIGSVLIGLILVWTYRQVMATKTQQQFFGLWAIGCLAVHSLLEYPIEYAFFLIPLGLLIGIVEHKSGIQSYRIKYSKVVGITVFAIGLVAISTLIIDYGFIKPKYEKLRFEAARFVDADKMLVPEGNIQWLTQVDTLMNFTAIAATENMSVKALEEMRQITARYPYPSSLYRYMLALGLNGHAGEANRLLKVINNLWGEERYKEALVGLRFKANKYKQLESVFNDEKTLPKVTDLK